MQINEFPPAWASTKVGDICNLLNGRAYKKDELLQNGKYKVLRVGNLFTNPHWFYSDLELEENKYCDNGDLLYAWSASFGPYIWDGNKVIYHYHIWKVEFPEELISKKFLRAYFDWDKEVIKREQGSGSTMTHVTKKSMEERSIPLPPLNEQRRIADKLDNTLAAVEACKQKLNNAAEIIQRFRQSVLAAAVSGELTREWREERGIDLENWNFEPLGSLVDIKTGPFGSSLHKSDYISGGTPIINPKHISNGKILHEKNTTVGDSDTERLKEFSLLPGDVILGRRGEMGRAACIGLQEAGWICGTGSLILRQKGSLQPEFLQLYLSSPSTIRTLESRSVGSTMVNLNQGILKKIVMPVPSKEEQSVIQLKVIKMQQKADEIHTLIINSYQNSEMLCRALIAKAFRGELVPQDPNDEPASVLLEQIKAQREAEAAAKKPAKRGRKKKADAAQLVIPEGIADNHLAKVLEECGALNERALLAASELEPAVFQLQLSKELKAGGLKQVDIDGEAAYADAAWEEEK